MRHIDAMVERELESLELDDVFLWVEPQSDDLSLLHDLGRRLPALDTVFAQRMDGELWIYWHGCPHRVPITDSPHDRYVTLSSAAAVLSPHYVLWLSRVHLASLTHGLLVLSAEDSTYLVRRHPGWVDRHLVPFELGFDYFNDIRVPYAGHEDHNPQFEQERLAGDDSLEDLWPEADNALSQAVREAARAFGVRQKTVRTEHRFWPR